jgi:uncharacterized hydrophobic protein (TIGR00271 family)
MLTEESNGKIRGIFSYLYDLIDLKQGIDKKGAITEIVSKNMMTGANAWMLMSSIVIASIGLNMNSPAVIIGAMLISPLMSPILSLGLGIATNDRKTLQRSLRHLSVAVLIAILTSTVYFLLSPFNELTAEIEARLEPTALDIIIAFFGGIAGIISYVRKDISTAVPGVAIATALMPPLCVTGFSLATGEWNMALSSFYLFFLNSFFVTFATYFILRYLKFPYKSYVNAKDKRRNNIYIIIFSILVIAPSLFLFNKVLQEAKQEVAIDSFIEEYFADDRIYLDDYQWIQTDTMHTLILKVYGNKINDQFIDKYLEGLAKHGIENARIEIIPTSEIRLERLVTLESKLTGVENISKQLEASKTEKEQQKELIDYLHNEIQSGTIDSSLFIDLKDEIKILYPEINELTLGSVKHTDFDLFSDKIPIAIINWPSNRFDKRDLKEKNRRIQAFIKQRIDADTLLYYSISN